MENILGHWLITECEPTSAVEGKLGIEKTSFLLSKSGEVRWNVSEGAADLPLLHCDTYEVVSQNSRGHYLEKAFLRFGTYRGHILDFQVDTFKLDADELVLSKGSWLIKCKKLLGLDAESAVPLSFLPALEDGYFSDLEIIAGNSKVFYVHSVILNLCAPNLDWTSTPPPLSGLPEEVLGTILHFLYAQCLPDGLPEKTARDIVHLASEMPQLEPLGTLCQSYLSHLLLKHRIVELVSEIHACATSMTERFQQKSDGTDAAKLCDAVKLSVRDTAVAYAKILLVSHLYHQKKKELTEGAEQEVIRYLQSRGPILLRQMKVFLSGLSSALNAQNGPRKIPCHLDLACYLMPELDPLLDTALELVAMGETAVEAVLRRGLKENEQHSGLSPLELDINRTLINKDFMRFDCFLNRLLCIKDQLVQKKEHFKVLTNSYKIRSLACALFQLIGEFPVFLLRLEEFAGTLELKFEWNESQFCFKVGTAKVCEILRKLVEERDSDSVRGLMTDLCRLVDREEFTLTLMELQLLSDCDGEDEPAMLMPESKTDPPTPSHSGYMLNLTEGLCVSPSADSNLLSATAEALLDSQLHTDMLFEVIDADGTVTRFPAHRVIVAARCDWFRRALLSGMQEDIQRRIEVHNTLPQLFHIFLRYLYTGRQAVTALNCQQLIELLILADCYEVDSLKSAMEAALKLNLREDSVVEVLDLADQLNAISLRAECIRFITECQDILDQDGFMELSMSLQAEVYDAVRLATGACICLKPGRRKPEGEKRGEPEGEADDSAIYRLVDGTSQLKIHR